MTPYEKMVNDRDKRRLEKFRDMMLPRPTMRRLLEHKPLMLSDIEVELEERRR